MFVNNFSFINLFLGLLFLSLFILLGALITLNRVNKTICYNKDWKKETLHKIISIFALFSCGIVLYICFSSLFFEYAIIVENSSRRMYSNELYIVIPDNQGVKAYENGVYVLEWSDFVQLPKNMIACSSVQPITDNPKVRTLKYEVGITVTDLNKLFYSPERLSHKTHYQAYEMVNGIVQYQLHEFNNINSKQLSLFYNPYEKEQLLALDSLIKNEINPLLAINGLSIHLKWFDVQ